MKFSNNLGLGNCIAKSINSQSNKSGMVDAAL